jgi:hypothetical protein
MYPVPGPILTDFIYITSRQRVALPGVTGYLEAAYCLRRPARGARDRRVPV